MKIKSKMWDKFRNGYSRLIILSILGVLAGSILIINPEETNDYIIILVGVAMVLDGIINAFEAYKKYLKRK